MGALPSSSAMVLVAFVLVAAATFGLGLRNWLRYR